MLDPDALKPNYGHAAAVMAALARDQQKEIEQRAQEVERRNNDDRANFHLDQSEA